jgi:uncharacterized membrane protein
MRSIRAKVANRSRDSGGRSGSSRSRSVSYYLLVLAYADEHRAAEVLAALQRLPFETLVETRNVACVIRRADWTVTIQHTANVSFCIERSRRWWQELIAAVIVVPGSAGAMRSAGDFGLRQGFERDVAAAFPPGSSALFVVVPARIRTRVSVELERFSGTLLESQLRSPPEPLDSD